MLEDRRRPLRQVDLRARRLAAPATSSSFITSVRQAARVVRGWDFDSTGNATNPLASYPATNHPYDARYQSLLTQAGAVQ